MHDIVQVARPRSLEQGPRFLGEQLLKRIREHHDPFGQAIGVRMQNQASCGLIDDDLVTRDVETNFRGSRVSERTPVCDPSLERLLPLLVLSQLDIDEVGWELQSAQLCHVRSQFSKLRQDVVLRVWRVRPQREVEIFRKTIGLEETLLHARAALEDPEGGHRKCGDAREQPPEHVVLLDDFRAQLPLRRPIENVLLGDHEAFDSGVRCDAETLIQRRQRLASFPR